MQIRNLFCYFLLYICIQNAFGQSDTLLQSQLKQAKNDKEKVGILLDFSKRINYSYPNLSYKYAKEALQLAEQINYPEGRSEAFRRMGIYYIYYADYPLALEYLSRALKIAESINNKSLISKCLMNLGLIYYDNKDFNPALNYFAKALRIAKEINDKQDISNCLTNFGNVYIEKGDYKLALEKYQEALNYFVEIQDKEGIAKSVSNIGNVYFYEGNYKAALDYYLKSYKINMEEDNKLDIIASLLHIGKVYVKMGRLDEGLEYCILSLDKAWEIHSQDDIQRACETLSEIYKKKKDYKTALGYFQMSTSIKEELNNQNRIKEFGKLEAKFQLERQEAEINLLKKDNALKEEQSQKEMLVKNIIIAGILLFSLIAVSVILYNKNQKEQAINQQLKARNKEIAAQAEKLTVLNEELDSFVYRSSHDLKAPLTSVLGLVSILKMELKEDKSVSMLDKVKLSIDKLLLVIHDLTNYSKNNRLKIENTKIDFENIISTAINDLHYLNKLDSIKIESEVVENYPFYSDPLRLSILVTNLLSNAIIHHDLKKDSPVIKIKVEQNKTFAKFTISDNGKGIDDDIKPKIFDMFFKGSNESPGSGLGLYIVNGVIKKLNGKLDFHSTNGEGSEFSFEIPNQAV